MLVADGHCDLSAVRDVPLAGADQQRARLKLEMRFDVSADLSATIHSSRFGCEAIEVGSLFGCLGYCLPVPHNQLPCPLCQHPLRRSIVN
jgi:hypothetical protein